MDYNYTKIANLDILEKEIKESSITIALSNLSVTGMDQLTISFKTSLSQSEETELNTIVNNHDGSQITPPEIEIDKDGRQVVRQAVTNNGWHYQAHSVQFEVNKLNSTYNKDYNGNDLGFCNIKIYDIQGNECTTQLQADTDGVKTVVEWKPNYDFEIISGNVRQLTKETVDSYLYVNAVAMTGYPAPYDKLIIPFTQGGINLNYIGVDEPLKTDGKASKYFKAGQNGDYFEIIINYDENILTNENRHKMSVIFEIYKSPV